MVTVQRAIQRVFSTVCLSVCLSVCVFLCSDDNDTKCSKLLKASLRGTSGPTLLILIVRKVISLLTLTGFSHFSGQVPLDCYVRLFQTYCSSHYGSVLWELNGRGFSSFCITWRRVLGIPYKTHTALLGPIIDSCHVSIVGETGAG